MKWIAKRDFFRTPQLADVEITSACKGATTTPPDALHIHRGAIFELGTSKNESELQTGKDTQRKLISELRCAGCIGDASDKDVVARVEQDVATDVKREASIAKANQQSVSSALVEALVAALTAKMAPAPAK